METYKNLSGGSNIVGYKIFNNGIEVVFGRKDGKQTHYVYTYDSAGKEAIDRMKKQALSGKGLNSFLSSKPSPQYERKY